MEDLRCWWCGIEPDAITEVVQFGGEVVQRIPVWPPGDHPHATEPPSPGQLEQAGHVALMRIMNAGSYQ